MAPPRQLVPLLLLFLLLRVCVSAAGSLKHDRRALVDIFHATGGRRWTKRGGWNGSGDVCGWHGVTCAEDEDGEPRVTRLLRGARVAGGREGSSNVLMETRADTCQRTSWRGCCHQAPGLLRRSSGCACVLQSHQRAWFVYLFWLFLPRALRVADVELACVAFVVVLLRV